MRFAAVVMLIMSAAGVVVALLTGAPTPTSPRHGTFGVSGLDGGRIAWVCVGLCVFGLAFCSLMRVWSAEIRPSWRMRVRTRPATNCSVSTTSSVISRVTTERTADCWAAEAGGSHAYQTSDRYIGSYL